MTEKHLPLLVNPSKLAEQGVVLSGKIEPKHFSRFDQEEIGTLSTAKVELSFKKNDQGFSIVEGQLEVKVTRECQRCLEPVEQQVKVTIELAILKSSIIEAESRPAALPEHYELFQQTEAKVPVVDLLEDDLILALPLVALHDHCEHKDYQPEELPEVEEKPNPFAVLEALKKDLKS